MLIRKNDIGAEIISILTKGMYLDPKDALREYIQNGIDASASDISVKIRQDLVVVQDNGQGMDRKTMRKSVRIGISEKNPKQKVGFMGIGIYSAFHLCDELHIFSKTESETPNQMVFNFIGMRETLEAQRELRFSNKFKPEDILALQDLMEENIEIEEIDDCDFPTIGTRIEMVNVEPSFFKTLSEFNEVSNYLEKVIPLPFHPNFKYGREIAHFINQLCKDKGIDHSFINLKLQINNESKLLFRPYVDELFENNTSYPPEFFTIGTKNDFYGIAWGCLNSSNNAIKNSNIRGFSVKKNGFTIGTSNEVLPFFGRQIYFNRYVGEFLVLHPKLLPNASRSEFEYSPLRASFKLRLQDVAEKYNEVANFYQEGQKSRNTTDDTIKYLQIKKVEVDKISNDHEKLLTELWGAKEMLRKLGKRKIFLDNSDKEKYNEVQSQLNSFLKEVSGSIDLAKKRKVKKRRTQEEIITDFESIPELSDAIPQEKFSSMMDMCTSIGLNLNKEFAILLELIDENYIRILSKDNEDYADRLLKLKNSFEELIEE